MLFLVVHVERARLVFSVQVEWRQLVLIIQNGLDERQRTIDIHMGQRKRSFIVYVTEGNLFFAMHMEWTKLLSTNSME